MSYIGNSPISSAFLTDTFSGNGSTTAFTMTVAPANTASVIVAITGVLQDPSTYSVSGTTLTFSAAPPTGTSNISVRYLGIPASGVTTTAYRTVTDTTATAGQTSFSIPSYTVGYIDVYRNGARLSTSDYTATTGTTVVLNNAATAGDTITTESFYVSAVLNALPQTGGTLSGQLTVNSATGQKPLIAQVNGTEVFEIDSSGNVGIGTATPTGKFQVQGGRSWLLANNEPYSLYVAYASGTNGYFIGGTSTSALAFSTADGTERARIDSSGNVGIGTTTLTSRLNLSTASGTTSILMSTNGNQNNNATLYNDATYFGIASNYGSTGLKVKFALQAPDNALTLDASGNLLVGTTTAQTGAKLAVTGGIQGTITSGTAVASTSGTAIDFTGIPSWVKRVTVMFSGVSSTGTSPFLIRLGTASGFESSGYAGGIFIFTGGTALAAMSSGFQMQQQNDSAANLWSGNCIITLLNASANTWTEFSTLSTSGGELTSGSASKSLAGTLTQVRITTVNGTDTFDAGSINILYEG